MAMRVLPTLTVGADPELFLVNVDGKFISAVGLIGGSKEYPRDIGEGCAVQEDNVAVEYNIKPCTNVDEFVKYNRYALKAITEHIKEQGLFPSITASKSFPEDQLLTQRSRVFGCDPDYNAWTGKENERQPADDANLRSAGGHIHIGSTLDKIQLIRWADVYLGLQSVLEDPDTDRRKLYGKAGSFRAKPYGVEYRTLSNYWIGTEHMMRTVYYRVEDVVRKVSSGRILDVNDGELIQKAINESDKELAADLIKEYA